MRDTEKKLDLRSLFEIKDITVELKESCLCIPELKCTYCKAREEIEKIRGENQELRKRLGEISVLALSSEEC